MNKNLELEKEVTITEQMIDLEAVKIQRKSDGTFIIDNNGAPFHITDKYPFGDITAEAIREYIAGGGEYIDYIEPMLELPEDEKVSQQISELKAQLTATDYKVIKSVESSIPLSDEVIVKRQSIRDEINLLEAKLESLKSDK